MPYLAHKSIQTPPDSTDVQRYMDMHKFISLIRTQRLYFPSICTLQLTDPLEGSVPMSWKHAQKVLFDSFLQKLRPYMYVNCWNIGNAENMAMWQIYGGHLAIQTTVGDLKDAFPDNDINIGQIDYRYLSDEEEPYNFVQYIYIKNRAYEHEKELRLMLADPRFGSIKEIIDIEKLLPEYEKRVSEDPNNPYNSIRVDLSKLIRKVYVSPNSNEGWHIENVRDLLERYGLSGIEVVDVPILKDFRKLKSTRC